MILKLRQPDRRRFRSPIRERMRREREYFYSAVTVLIVRIVLFVFLAILADVSVRLFHVRFPSLSPPVRYAVPAIIVVFAIVNIIFIFKSFKQLRDMRRERIEKMRRSAD